MTDERASVEAAERRRSLRFVSRCRARVWVGGRWWDVAVVNLSRGGIWVANLLDATPSQAVTLLLSPLDSRFQVAVRGTVRRVDEKGTRMQFDEGQVDIGPWIRRMIMGQVLPQLEERLRQGAVDPETLAEALAWESELAAPGTGLDVAGAADRLSSEEQGGVERFRVALRDCRSQVDARLAARAEQLRDLVAGDLDFDIDIIYDPWP
jgi:hypothetical protein